MEADLLHVGVRHEGLLLALDGELEPVQGLVRAGAPHRHLYTSVQNSTS